MTAKKRLYGAALCALVIGALKGCATISKTECLAGNWSDLGYRDGIRGVSQSRISDYANTCSKHGRQIDRAAYTARYAAGLTLYCVPDNGYEIGRQGSRFTNVCAAPQYEGFREAFYEGREHYEVEQERKRMIRAEHDQLKHYVDDTEDEIDSVQRRLEDPEIERNQSKRLRKKLRRLQERREYQIDQLRDFERANSLSYCYSH